MRLKRRLMVVVRLVTDGAECKHGASFPRGCDSRKHQKNSASCATGANLCRQELLTSECGSSLPMKMSETVVYSTAKPSGLRPTTRNRAHVYLRSSRRNSLFITCQKFLDGF